MYNEELEDEEQDSRSSGSFLANFYYNNKVLVWIFIGIIIFILLMSLLTKGGSNSGSNETIKYDVTMSPPEEEIVVAIGGSTNLYASVTNNPAGVITWSVEDQNIAKVDNGNVVGLNYGRTKVTATYIHSDDSIYSASKNIIVADGDPNVTLTDVSFKTGDLFMPLNSTYELKLVLTPSKGFVESKVFTSSNTNVVTVDKTGLVRAVGEGEAIISSSVNGGVFKNDLHVYVNRDYANTEIIITPNDIRLDGELRKIKVGTRERLTYVVSPETADKSKLYWTSSDESVLKVDENGYITGLKAGTATVTLSSINGKKDRIDIEVETDVVPVSEIYLSLSDMYLTPGQSQTITPMISPDNASNKTLTYTSLDSSIAVVVPNATGTQATVTGILAGSTTIVIRSTNNIEKRLYVTVTGSENGNNNNNNNNNNGGGGGGSSSSSQGFKMTSSDYYGQPYINNSYEQTVPRDNGGTAPIKITVTKTDSSVSKLKVVKCSYPAGSSCNENLSGITVTGTGTFTLDSVGVYVLRVYEYNSSNAVTRITDKYIWVKDSKSTSTVTTYPTITCPEVKVGSKVTCTVKNGSLQGSVAISNLSVAQLTSTGSSYFIIQGLRVGSTVGSATVSGKTVSFTIKVNSALNPTATATAKPTATPKVTATPKPTTAPVTCSNPTSLEIFASGKVSWTNSSSATGYQISVGGSSWTDATNGNNYNGKIIAQSGERRVCVRSKCSGGRYSDGVCKTIVVRTINITSISGVTITSPGTGNKNYIGNAEVTIKATSSTPTAIQFVNKDTNQVLCETTSPGSCAVKVSGNLKIEVRKATS